MRLIHRATAIFVAASLAACGPQTPSASDARTITIEMRDFAFSPESLRLRAGERVTLAFTNVGKVEHEFMAGTDSVYGKGYVSDWLADVHVDLPADHGMDHAGKTLRVPPNTTRTLTFVVPSHGGVFEFGCFVIGHYELGMHGRLVVDVAAPPGGTAEHHSGGPTPPSAAPTHAPMDDDGEGH